MAFWWVNQGITYAAERRGGYIWAPITNATGRTFGHWTAMTEIRAGDTVIHYAGGIRAVSVATGSASATPIPPELNEGWDRDGRLVPLEYTDAIRPVLLAEIPLELRIAERGPFNRIGAVNQGYLFPLSDAFARSLFEAFRDRLGDTPSEPDDGGVETADAGILPQDPALRRAIELYAVDATSQILEGEFGAGSVRRMPPNNPGYDLRVTRLGARPLYVEVKGTTRPLPVFLMSETERAFSANNRSDYRLVVVWGIDVDRVSHSGVEVRDGEVAPTSHGLVVQRWQGRIPQYDR